VVDVSSDCEQDGEGRNDRDERRPRLWPCQQKHRGGRGDRIEADLDAPEEAEGGCEAGDPPPALQNGEDGDEKRNPAVVREDRDEARADGAESHQHGAEEAERRRRDLGRDRDEERERDGVEDGLEPARLQRRRLAVEDERVEAAVGGEAVEDEDVCVRFSSVEVDGCGSEVLSLVVHVHKGVGVVVGEEHEEKDEEGHRVWDRHSCLSSGGGDRQECLSYTDTRSRQRAQKRPRRQQRDDRVVPTLRVMRHRR
jgi:hypothetical protein